MALLYLLVMIAVGDTVGRLFLRYGGAIHRLAAAFLVGLLICSWVTYLVANALSSSEVQPLTLADPIVIAAGLGLVGVRLILGRAWRWRPHVRERLAELEPSTAWDWIVLNLLAVLVVWLMTQTLGFRDGQVLFGAHEWGDVGPTLELAQSFAVGHNYPTTYPLFPGPPILYHFLFYFTAGNLTSLGLDPAAANNVLAIGSLISLLGLVMTLGRRLFASPVVGRIAAILFFFHGSLAFVPFLRGFTTPADALNATLALDHYLPSGLPYRGEDWATWSLNVFLNQRHLASAIGIVVVALVFVVDRLLAGLEARATRTAEAAAAAERAERAALLARLDRATSAPSNPRPAKGAGASQSRTAGRIEGKLDDGRRVRATANVRPDERRRSPLRRLLRRGGEGLRDRALGGYAFVGLLLGLMPLWNGPMFIAAAVLFALVFVLFANRVQLAVLGAVAGLVALPQVLFLRQPGVPGTVSYPALHLGYTVDPPSLLNLATFLGADFGPKLVLALVGLVVATWTQRRLFLAVCGIALIAFTVQLSNDIVADHKFLNAWLVIVNVFAAWGLVRLWRAGSALRTTIATGARATVRRSSGLGIGLLGKAAAVGLATIIVVGGVIDLMPIKNDGHAAYRLAGDPAYDWVITKTGPGDVFLSDVDVVDPMLLAGRPIYFGWPVYAWSAGYDTPGRQKLYSRMLEETSPRQLLQLLQANAIDYVVWSDSLRKGGDLVRRPNEAVFRDYFEAVFTEPGGRWGNLVVYRVPQDPAVAAALPNPTPLPTPTPTPVSMLSGGRGDGPGKFADPRGLAIAANGEVLVADAGNHRIQRFGPDGAYLSAVGVKGNGPGEFNEPDGVAVDSRGHVFVADTANQRVQELDAGFGFVRSWTGPEPGFYGPRDVVIGPDDALYVLDQGHGRVVRLGRDAAVSSFGSVGRGVGQTNDPTGLAVSRTEVFVADPSNGRIQVFGLDGRSGRSIPVPEWRQSENRFADVAVTADGRTIYASSAGTHEIVVFDGTAGRVGTLVPAAPDRLGGPGALALKPGGGLYVADYDTSRIVLLPTSR